MQRHAKQLKQKSNQHLVERIDRRWYNVTSATSERVYRCYVRGDNTVECNCDWSKKRQHDDNAIACSHTIAVLAYIEAERTHTVSAWSHIEDAARQHRPVINMNDGVLLTTRLQGA